MAIVVEKGKNRYIFTDTTNLEDTLEFARSCGGEYRKIAYSGGDIKNFARARDWFALADACEEALCMQSTAHKGTNTNLSSMEYYDGLLQEVALAAESMKTLKEEISGMLQEYPELFEHRNVGALSRIRLFDVLLPKPNEKHRTWEQKKCFDLNLDFVGIYDERILLLEKKVDELREANEQLERSKTYLFHELEVKKARLAEDHEPYRLLDAVIQTRNLKRLVGSLVSYFRIQNEEWDLLVELLNEPIFRESRWATYFYQKKEETEKQISNIKWLLAAYDS